MPLEPESGRLTPDRDLVLRMAAGDAQALAELRRRHDRTMYAIAYAALGDSGDAAHVVSETFLQAARAAMQFDAVQEQVPAWLSAILRQRTHEMLQRRPPPFGVAAAYP